MEVHEVGCRQCGQGGKWMIFSDGEKVVEARCSNCKHSVEIQPEIKTQPDKQAYHLRMFT